MVTLYSKLESGATTAGSCACMSRTRRSPLSKAAASIGAKDWGGASRARTGWTTDSGGGPLTIGSNSPRLPRLALLALPAFLHEVIESSPEHQPGGRWHSPLIKSPAEQTLLRLSVTPEADLDDVLLEQNRGDDGIRTRDGGFAGPCRCSPDPCMPFVGFRPRGMGLSTVFLTKTLARRFEPAWNRQRKGVCVRAAPLVCGRSPSSPLTCGHWPEAKSGAGPVIADKNH